MNKEATATLGVMSMFIFSGIRKLLFKSTQNFEVNRLQKIVKYQTLAFFFVILAGIFELVASSLIVRDVLDEDQALTSKSKYYVYSLMAFTVVVTFMFYAPPFAPFKERAFLSNIVTFSALMFVLIRIERNTKRLESNTISSETIERVEELFKEANLPKPESHLTGMADTNRQSVNGYLPLKK